MNLIVLLYLSIEMFKLIAEILSNIFNFQSPFSCKPHIAEVRTRYMIVFVIMNVVKYLPII